MELPEAQVLEFARKISGLREQLRQSAATVASQPDQLQFYEEKELQALATQVSREHYPLVGAKKRSRAEARRQGQSELPQETPPGLKRRRRRAKPLDLDQKLRIVERVIIDCESQADVAKDYRISAAAICILIAKVRKKPELLRELISQRSEKQLGELALAEFIEDRLSQG